MRGGWRNWIDLSGGNQKEAREVGWGELIVGHSFQCRIEFRSKSLSSTSRCIPLSRF